MHRAFAEFFAQAGIDCLRQARFGACLITRYGNVIKLGIDDAPLDEGIDEDVFLFRRDETLRLRRIERQDTLVEQANVLDQWPFEIESGRGNHFLDLAQLKNDGVLALIDSKDRRSDDHQNNGKDAADDIQSVTH